MDKKIIYSILLVLLVLGTSVNTKAQSSGAYYKIVDLEGEVTKKVNLWGYINRPGRYEIPISTNLIELITYAGGPKEYALMDEIKIYRLDQFNRKIVLTVDLDDPSEVSDAQLEIYENDTIYIDYSAVLTWRDVLSLISGPLAVLASIALIVDRLTAR